MSITCQSLANNTPITCNEKKICCPRDWFWILQVESSRCWSEPLQHLDLQAGTVTASDGQWRPVTAVLSMSWLSKKTAGLTRTRCCDTVTLKNTRLYSWIVHKHGQKNKMAHLENDPSRLHLKFNHLLSLCPQSWDILRVSLHIRAHQTLHKATCHGTFGVMRRVTAHYLSNGLKATLKYAKVWTLIVEVSCTRTVEESYGLKGNYFLDFASQQVLVAVIFVEQPPLLPRPWSMWNLKPAVHLMPSE